MVLDTSPDRPVAPAVTIKFNSMAAKDAAIEAYIDAHEWLEPDGNCIDDGALTIIVRPPDGSRLRAGDTRIKKLATVTPCHPAKLPPHALNAIEWRKLGLALDGVVDDTKSPEQVRRIGAENCVDHLWEDLIPRGAVTILAAPPKCGKSTLLRAVLRAGVDGGSLLGAAVAPLRALVTTEEQVSDWRDAPDNTRLRYHHRPPIRKMREWVASVDSFQKLAKAYGCDLIVLDSIASILGVNEDDSRAVTKAMAPLRNLLERDLAVLILHHTVKSGTGTSSVRGSSAWTATADSVLTLRLAGEDEADPRRVLSAAGRGYMPHKIPYELRDGALVLPAVTRTPRRQSLRGARA